MFLISGLERGGTELRLLELARRLPLDLAVQLCVTSPRVPLKEAFESTGAIVQVVPIDRPWVEWGQVRAVVHLVRRRRAQVINSFDLKGLLIGTAVRLLVGSQLQLVHHLVDLQFGLSQLQRRVLWTLLQRADAIVCDARSIRDEVIGTRRLRPPVLVIPNGVDVAAFRPDATARARVRSALGIADSDILLGCVANFRPEKNHRLLVAAFHALHEELPGLRLVCVGGGPLLEENRKEVAALGLGDAVRFTGYVDEVRDYLAAMDVFVLPSLRDAFSNAVLQAMSMGVPCVCARTGDYQHIMAGDRCGILFDPSDLADCTSAIRRVVVDDRLRQRIEAEASALIETDYSIDAMVRQYARFFRTVGTAGPPPDPRDTQTTAPA